MFLKYCAFFFEGMDLKEVDPTAPRYDDQVSHLPDLVRLCEKEKSAPGDPTRRPSSSGRAPRRSAPRA